MAIRVLRGPYFLARRHAEPVAHILPQPPRSPRCGMERMLARTLPTWMPTLVGTYSNYSLRTLFLSFSLQSVEALDKCTVPRSPGTVPPRCVIIQTNCREAANFDYAPSNVQIMRTLSSRKLPNKFDCGSIQDLTRSVSRRSITAGAFMAHEDNLRGSSIKSMRHNQYEIRDFMCKRCSEILSALKQ